MQPAQNERSGVAGDGESAGARAASRAARLRIDPDRDAWRSTAETFDCLREKRLGSFAERCEQACDSARIELRVAGLGSTLRT